MLKTLSKKIVKSTPVRMAVCWLTAQYIRIVWMTSRWERIGTEHFDALYDSGQPAILCFWHGRLLMAPYTWRKPHPFKMLISAHRDGELIANTVAHFGIDWVKGSSSKGGAGALRAMVKALRAGEWVGITPDGPRGPRMRVSDGIINLAKLSGVPILPVTYGIKRGINLGSWDRFLAALPFSSGVLIWGEALSVPRDADDAALAGLRRELEQRLNTITEQADRLTHRTPVEPAQATDGLAA
ncbi:lysophospholipid acyltransferase family protein [Thalassospiraceae bacterium LMO-JJ14]|nr:lysophospholipid acyltransferase family protein [Thalassospiraceae bacterium LMO-JJ14]